MVGFPPLTHDRDIDPSDGDRVLVSGFDDCSLLYIFQNKPKPHSEGVLVEIMRMDTIALLRCTRYCL